MPAARDLGFTAPTLSPENAREYLEEAGLGDLFKASARPDQIAPDWSDLARLHWLAVSRSAFTVLEFGVGWSTLVLAAAMRENRRCWDQATDKPKIRNHSPFTVHSVCASSTWIDNARRLLPDELRQYVHFSESVIEAGTFGGRMCHFYARLPDVVPDLVYLDGPDPADVSGDVNGLTWRNPDRTVLSGDLLVMESTLLPGTCVLIDGRTNNARFLRNNLQRQWGAAHDVEGDVTILELQESPLGEINRQTLHYCLGRDYLDRLADNDAGSVEAG